MRKLLGTHWFIQMKAIGANVSRYELVLLNLTANIYYV